MVSKRSARTYLDEADGDGCGDAAARRERSGPALDDTFAVDMERSSSSSSSSWTGSDASSATGHSDRSDASLGNELALRAVPEGLMLPGSLGLQTAAAAAAAGRRPNNFGIVLPGVYRSSYPRTEDFSFIQSLKLKTIVTLVDRDIPDGYRSFVLASGIKHHVFDTKGTKKQAIPVRVMNSILRQVLDSRNYPLLIHCNHGKHRTGCVVAVMRKLAGLDMASIIDEYKAYAAPKVRQCDLDYIAGFQMSSLASISRDTARAGLRVPNFFRVTLFTIVALVVWALTGPKIMASSPKRGRAPK